MINIVLKFVSDSFRIMIAIIMVIVAISSLVAGIYMAISDPLTGIGILIGGFLSIVIVGGYIATFLKNAENLEKIAKKMDELSVEQN